MNKPNRGLAHCCHHDRHWEWCFDFAGRLAYINKAKPAAELELRKRLFRLIPVELLPPQLAEAGAKLDKADAKWIKADAEWAKTDAEWAKAYAKLAEANAELDKANAEWAKANAELDKADAEWAKANAERAKAYVESNNAHAEWDKVLQLAAPELAILHVKLFPDCPWDGKTIFGGQGK